MKSSVMYAVVLPIPLVLFLTMLFAPGDVLAQWSWARVFVNEMNSLFPFIPLKVQYSSYSDVIVLSSALMLPVVILQLLLLSPVAACLYSEIARNNEANVKNWKRVCGSCAAFLLLLGWYCVNRDLDPDLSGARALGSNRLLLAVLDSAIAFVVPLIVYLLVVTIQGAIKSR